MKDLELLSKLKELIKEEIEESPYYKNADFSPYDHFGGNMDDAYWGGVEDGRIQLAEELMELINNNE